MDNILFDLNDRPELVDAILRESVFADVKTYKGEIRKQKFSDGELCVDFIKSVRGKRVYLLSTPNTSDAIIELFLAIDAAKRGDAEKIIPILLTFPYDRSDKKDQDRGPVGAKVMAKTIENLGATGIITFDLHADQLVGFVDIPITHIEGRYVFYEQLLELINENKDIVLVGPDEGSSKRLKRFKKLIEKRTGINLPMALIEKTREKANEVSYMNLIGDVKGKHAILIDDIMDTGGTTCKAGDLLLKEGALSVNAIISHPVLSGKAYDNIFSSSIVRFYFSDSIPIKSQFEKKLGNASITISTHDKISVISVAKQIGMAMAAINCGVSFETLKESPKFA